MSSCGGSCGTGDQGSNSADAKLAQQDIAINQSLAEAAAERYAGRGVLWEIWNEANLKQFWSPQPSVDDYCKLVEASASRIRNADPSGQVVAGATSGIPFEWLEDCFKRGLLQWIDVL